jgi:CelD/BcsL family acetyltransferase involved in cellulose biosynthesis
MLKPHLLRSEELTAPELTAWDRLQRASAAYSSPFFRPEWVRAVATVRDNVEIAVLEERGEVVGFFPFQRHFGCVARPVGGPLCDFQGPILSPDTAFSPVDLLRYCDLRTWEFDHLITDIAALRRYHWLIESSPDADVGGSFAGYESRLEKPGMRELSDTRRQTRRIQREVGPLRFEFHTADRQVLEQLMEWKSAQYRRTKITDIFSFGHAADVLRQVLEARDEAFSAVLTALYVGDHLAAAHLGLRCFSVLHWWLPAYNVTFSKYSPGKILLVEALKHAAADGIRRLDFGKGMTLQKRNFMTGETRLAEGCVHTWPVLPTLHRNWFRARELVRGSPLRVPAGRVYRRAKVWLGY